jgi:hypothetical protein
VFCSGPEPLTTTAPETGIRLALLDLPEDWIGSPTDGVMLQVGVWEQLEALETGLPGYFRVYDTTLTVCHMQGTIGIDLTGSPSAAIVAGSPCGVVGWSWIER